MVILYLYWSEGVDIRIDGWKRIPLWPKPFLELLFTYPRCLKGTLPCLAITHSTKLDEQTGHETNIYILSLKIFYIHEHDFSDKDDPPSRAL